MSEAKLFFLGVKALIQDENGEILLLLADVTEHRKNTEPYWDIPGGRIENNDSALQTLEREIQEETGIRGVKNQSLLTAVISNHEIPLDNGKIAGLVLMVYTVTIPKGATVTLSEEHTDYKWATTTEAKELLAHKYPADFVNSL